MKRICLWSGPRNISTALMYSFAQRPDTVVYDEPLYAHYLSCTNAADYHPGAEEILSSMEKNGNKVIEMMLGEHPKPVVFFKHMTHHLVDIDLAFLNQTINVFLTRDPVDMLPSFVKQINQPTLRDVGYKAHLDLMQHLENIGQEVLILDSKRLQSNPRAILSHFCQRTGIPFYEDMLKWNAGARPEDGCWAKYWYHNVHRSTHFSPYQPKADPFPERLLPLLEECQPIYKQLLKRAI